MNDACNKIDPLRRELKLSVEEFACAVGESTNSVANWRKRNIGTRVINKIVKAFPQVSREWLMTGEGPIFKEIHGGVTETPRLRGISHEAIAESLGNNDPAETPGTMAGQPSMKNNSKWIPLIPTSAMAGRLSGDNCQIMPYEIESYFIIPAFVKSDFCIRVEGNSMEPNYYNGDIIACKYVPMTDIWFQWGKVYVISTDQGVLVKHIEKGSDKEHVMLVSDNPAYQPFEIPTDGIYSVAIINGLIRVE